MKTLTSLSVLIFLSLFVLSVNALNLPVHYYDTYTASASLPPIGKWMVTKDKQVAHWLGQIQKGQYTIEPINFIFVVKNEKNSLGATLKLAYTLHEAGYRLRFGHTGHYQGYIGNKLESEVETNLLHAFSNHTFLKENDHMRIFGPYPDNGNDYIYIASMSREKPVISKNSPTIKRQGKTIKLPCHIFISFSEPRFLLNNKIKKVTGVTSDKIFLDNTFSDSKFTTRDHDGYADEIVIN